MRSKAEGEVDNNCKDNGTGNTGRRCAKVNRNRCEGSRGEGNNANDDGGLSYRLSINFEDKFHPPSDEKRGDRMPRAQGKVLERRLRERMESRDSVAGGVTATAPPWFYVWAKT